MDYKKMKVDITSQIPAVYIVEALAKLTVQRKQVENRKESLILQ